MSAAKRTPADVHRDWLNGLLTNGEFTYYLLKCGADDETVRREVPDRELLRDYFEHLERKRAGMPAGFVMSSCGKTWVKP